MQPACTGPIIFVLHTRSRGYRPIRTDATIKRMRQAEGLRDVTSERSGAEILVESLVAKGVEFVFGYPGGAVLNLYDELYKNSDRIRHVLTAHEQGCSEEGVVL